jgi:hypothetical protein
MERCRVEEPAIREVRPGHQVACHLREVDTAAFATAGLTGMNSRPK